MSDSAVNRSLLLALAFLLAGCSSPEPEAALGQPPEPVFEDVAFQATGYIGSLSCLVVNTGCLSSRPTPIAATNDWQAARSLHIEVADIPGEDRTLEWEVTCVGDTQACRSGLGAGSGTLPLAIDLDGLTLLPGVQFRLLLRAPPYGDGRDHLGLFVSEDPQVTGTIHAEIVAARQYEDVWYLDPVQVPVAADGDTGPCAPPECPPVLSGAQAVVIRSEELAGRILRLQLTVTWEARTPVEQVMHLTVGSANLCDTCSPPQRASGTSPLVVEAQLVFEDGLYVVLDPDDPTGGLPGGPIGLRTQYHVDGTVTVANRG